jgi:acyl-CoA carboxylase subunit beta
VAASFATLPNVILAEPGAHVGFAGPRVIQQTIGQRLPEGFQTAEFVFSHGLIDGVTSRAGLRATLARLLEGQRQTSPPPPPQPAGLIHDPDQLPVRNPWEVLQLARRPDRPTTLDYVEHILDDFQELHGDRLSGDCPAIVGGVGRLNGRAVMLIGHQKGHSTRERMARNFGMPTPTGYRKAARLMRLAAKLALPVVTLIDTPGAYPGVDAEERGQAWAIAENLRLMSGLPVPVVAMVTGEGGSGGALALGVANCVLALSNAVYSVISPEGCAAILWKSPEAAPQAAAALGLESRELLRQGVVDAVVPEPEGGAHADPAATACLVRAALSESLHRLARTDPRELVAQRRRRFRIMGCRRPEEG